ncbi:MaoC family dehydratase [soil metagenome]
MSSTSLYLYLEDLALGQVYLSGTYEVTAAEIKEFAAKYDPQPFHLDEEAAAETFFAGLAASGWLTASITMRLLVDGGLPISGGLIGAGGEITWTRPTRPGDILQVESEVIEIADMPTRPTSGLVTVRSRVRNQDKKVVQVLVAKLLVPRRNLLL